MPDGNLVACFSGRRSRAMGQVEERLAAAGLSVPSLVPPVAADARQA